MWNSKINEEKLDFTNSRKKLDFFLSISILILSLILSFCFFVPYIKHFGSYLSENGKMNILNSFLMIFSVFKCSDFSGILFFFNFCLAVSYITIAILVIINLVRTINDFIQFNVKYNLNIYKGENYYSSRICLYLLKDNYGRLLFFNILILIISKTFINYDISFHMYLFLLVNFVIFIIINLLLKFSIPIKIDKRIQLADILNVIVLGAIIIGLFYLTFEKEPLSNVFRFDDYKRITDLLKENNQLTEELKAKYLVEYIYNCFVVPFSFLVIIFINIVLLDNFTSSRLAQHSIDNRKSAIVLLVFSVIPYLIYLILNLAKKDLTNVILDQNFIYIFIIGLGLLLLSFFGLYKSNEKNNY